MRRPVSALGLALLITTAAPVGCLQPKTRFPLPPLPMADAVEIVNRNLEAITGTLRASGKVDGRLTLPDGTKRSFHLDGVLFYLRPAHVRFDLHALGSRQFLFGSNEQHLWYYDKADDAFYCNLRGDEADWQIDLPVRLDQIVDALGLTPIPTDAVRIQRVTNEFQQILFITTSEDGAASLEKEIWLDRYSPRLVRRVIIRDAIGNEAMRSDLSDYAPAFPGGPLLPHKMTAEWPAAGARLEFRPAKWSLHPEIGQGAIQFAPPPTCDAP